MRRIVWPALAAGAFIFLCGMPVRAQTMSVTPLVGAYVPTGNFQELLDQAGELWEVERRAELAVGLNVQLGSLRGSLAYITGSELTREGVTGTEDLGDGSLLAGALDLVVRPIPRILGFQAYALGGVGFKRESYSYDQDGFDDPFPSSERNGTAHFGVGADFMLGRIGVVAEVTDFLSRSETGDWDQHDAFAMVGLRIGLF
jgi:hypothetical protein